MRPTQRTSTGATPVPPHRSKWKRRLLAAFVVLFSLLIFAPILAAGTPLRNWLLTAALPRFQGSIRIGGASVGWFRPPIFTDIEVHDSAGRMLLHIPRLEGNKSLAALVCQPFDLGEFRLTQPVLHVVCSRDSSNLEALLAYWLQKKDTPSDSGLALDGIALRAVLAQARVILEDEDSGHTWSLDPLDLSVAIPRDRRTPMRVELNATAGSGSGQLKAEVSAHFVTGGTPVPPGAPRLRAEGELCAGDLPLDAAGPFLRRLAPHLQLGGRLNANVRLRSPPVSPPVPGGDTGGNSPDVRLEGNVALQELTLSDPLLGTDVLRLERVQAPLRIALDGCRLTIEQLEIQSEIGKISHTGTIDLAKDLRNALVQPGHRVEAELNVARLADLVPNALHLTKDTRMQSGTLSLHLHSLLRDDRVFWEGDLHTSDLEGLYQGQRVTWKEPFAVVWTAHQEMSDPLPVLERFRCDSDFLRLEMSGSLREWTARGSFNLGRLSEHLAGFVELGSLRVQGEGTLRATARRNPCGGYRLESDVGFTQLSLADGARAWREDSLTIRLDLIGNTTGGYRIDAGAMHVLAGKDGIDLDLLEPIADGQVRSKEWGVRRTEDSSLLTPHSSLLTCFAARARLRCHGDLARWRDRASSLTGMLDGMRLAGQIDADCRLRYESETVHLEDVKIAGRAVRFGGFGLSVDEPVLDFTTSGRWLPGRETLELQHTRLSCPTVTAQAPAVTLGIDPVGAWQFTASATVQGDVARLLKVAGQSDGLVGGALAGRIDLRPDEGRQIVQLELNVHNLVLGSPAAPVWHESRVNLIGHGVYDVVKDSLQMVQLHLDSPTLSCDAAGQLRALSSDMELSLEGKLGYDLEKWEPQLRPYLGPGVKLSGRDVRPFHIAGALRAEASGGALAPREQAPGALTRPRSPGNTNAFSYGTAWVQGFLEGGLITFLSIYLLMRGYTEGEVSFLVGGLFAGVILCQVPVAWLADRLGRLHVLIGCHLLLMTALLLVRWCPGTPLLAVALFLLGTCCGALYPLGLALLGERVPPAGLARANANYLASNCAGSLCGPALLGLVIDRFGQPAQFLAGTLAITVVVALGAGVPRGVQRLAASRRRARFIDSRETINRLAAKL